MKIKHILISVTLWCISGITHAQIGIGTTSPDASSILDITSTTKGILPPRVASDSDVLNPAEGLIIYDQSDNCINVFNNQVWVNLCDGSTVQPSTPGSQNSGSLTLASDCEGAFNISTFGENAYYKTGHQHYHFRLHLNADGSKLYSNYGHYYDTNSVTQHYLNAPYGDLQSTVQAVAIEQIFPGKFWKDFVAIDVPANNYDSEIYLLAKDGELCSTPLLERHSTSNPVATSYYQLGMSTSIIDPTDDDKYIKDPGLGYQDYRFTPYKHFVDDDVNSTVKYSSLHYYVNETTGNHFFTILPYDSVGKKFYSFGSRVNSSLWGRFKLTDYQLFRTTDPGTLKESITVREADLINKVIEHFNTEFEEGDGFDATFVGKGLAENYASVYFITKDGYVNAIARDKVYRLAPPAGLKAVSFAGRYQSLVLCDDGKVYSLGSSLFASGGFTSTSNYNIPGIGNVTLRERNTSSLYFSQPEVNALDIKRISYTSYADEYNVLATDGKLYKITLSNGITDDYNADYNIPRIEELLSGKLDMVVRDSTGLCFGVVRRSDGEATDLPQSMIGFRMVNIDGMPLETSYPVNRQQDYRARAFISCFGN